MNLEEVGSISRFILNGKLDAKGAEQIELRFTAAVSGRTKVAIDLAAVDYISSIGIRILVVAGKTVARRGGKLVMFSASETVAKILMAAGVTDFLPLLEDWAAASQSFA